MAAITQWREKSNSIYGAVLILSLMPLIEGVVAIYDNLSSFGSSLLSMVGRQNVSNLGADTSELFVTVLMVFAYIMYFAGLTGFAKLQAEEDANSVLRIRNGAIWGLVAELLACIPLFGWLLAFVANVVSFFIMISGYSRLKHSYTFPEEARRGAGLLRAAMIWNLVAVIVHIIPLLGPVIAGIIFFILFFVVLSGWGRIKHAVPLTIAGRTTIDRLKMSEVPSGSFIAWGITLTAIAVVLADWVFVRFVMPTSTDNPIWNIYNYSFYFSYSLGLLLLLVGIAKMRKQNASKGKGFTTVLVGAAIWLGSWLLDTFTYYAIRELNMNLYLMYRVCNLMIIVACILFIVGFRKLASTCSDRLMREGTKILIGSFSLLLFQQLFFLEVMFIGEYREKYGQLYWVLPWIYLYLGVIGWRSILSSLYGKGVVVPADDLNSRPKVQDWIPQNSEADEQLMQRMEAKSQDELKVILANEEDYSESFVRAADRMLKKREEEQAEEAMRTKVSQKTDEELKKILADSEDYNPALLKAVREECERREQDIVKKKEEKKQHEEELSKYGPKSES